ncbi:MAG: site-specific integrase [Opitutae bacterium]
MPSIIKRGEKYQVQIRRKGYPSRSKNFTYLADAKKWALKIERDFETEPHLDQRRPEQFTFFELADRFDRVVINGLKSAARERSRLRLMKSRLGDVSASDIDARYLASYRDSRTESVSPQTIKHEINMVRRILRFGIQECGLRLADGVPSIRLAKLPRGRSRRLQDGEYDRLIANLSAEMCDVVDLALETAMRRSELLKLTPKHVAVDNRLIRVEDPKNGVDRNIPLTRKALEIVAARLGDKTVFSMKPDSVTRSFQRACRVAGITDLRFHDLRHEAISRLFEEGLSVVQVASISGHSDYRMLARYTHLRGFSRLEAEIQHEN